MSAVSLEREARRQRTLLAALREPSAAAPDGIAERGERLAQGLRAYRANAAASAERALAAACPTVRALLGGARFAALARALWQAAPPLRGDLAAWGHDLPEALERSEAVAAMPWLPDCARLDLALQRCESAADARLERDSLALLAAHAPAVLRLHLLPSVQLLASAWPIAALHAACSAAAGDDAPLALDVAPRAEAVVVARAGWRAVVTPLTPAECAWMHALHDGADLAAATDAAGAGFDTAAWLLRALQQAWLWKAECLPAGATRGDVA